MTRTNTCRVCCMLALFVLPWLVGASLYADEGDPPARAARLSVMQGNVSFQPSGEDQWSQATLNYTLTTGDRLYTDQGARAEVEIGPVTVRMSEGTDLTLANLNDQAVQLGLGQGAIRVSVYAVPEGSTLEIDTPNGALLPQGPGSYRVDVDPNYGTRVSVTRGSLEITGGGTEQRLDARQAVELTGTGPIQVNPVDFPGRDGFDQWSDSRDARIRSFASRRYVSPNIPGAEDLDGYGRWDTVSDYGPVWYPSGVAAGWVPYRYGHWAWVEPWGWTWVEDEPWGFCPFHYGRWAFIGSAWGWVPGPVVVAPVYAPALVAFVGGGGFSVGVNLGGVGVAAWFPLGPREAFVPWYHYSGNYIRQVNVTNIRNVTNITNITNITNVNNIHYQYRTVATTAVSAEAFRSGQPVARQVVHIAPEQLARAQVVAHPNVAPVKTAAFGGRPPVPTPPVRTPPVRNARMTAPLQGARPGQPQSPGQTITRGTPPPASAPAGRPSFTTPPAERTAPPPATASRPSTPPPTSSAPAGRPSYTPPPAERTAPPPATASRPSSPPPTFERPASPAPSTPGRPSSPPPTFERPATPAGRSQPGQPAQPAPSAPSGGGHFQPFGRNAPPAPPPPRTPPPVITRTPPPPRDVPFTVHQPAYQQHPGRPLEPQQEQNLRAGRPAGPMQDREVAPHAPAPRSAPPPRSEPPPRSAPPPNEKQHR